METYMPLSTLGRFYIYAIHGYVTEIMFTALWDFTLNMNWKFPGSTSVWSMPIYGLSTLAIEWQFFFLRDKLKLPLVARALIYTLWAYCWEFSTGFVLRLFDACPWDYTAFQGDFMGLITLEYAPLWFMLVIIAEKVVIRSTLHLHWGPPWNVDKDAVTKTDIHDTGDKHKTN